MAKPRLTQPSLDPAERKRRQAFLYATIVTCLGGAMIFGVMHVVKLGANRIADMRAKASYDLADEHRHIRAAGEDIEAQRIHEEKTVVDVTYQTSEVDALLAVDQWQDLARVIPIPGGSFLMGSNSERTDDFNKPEHRVELLSFSIDKYPVTNAEYAKFVAVTRHRPPLDWEAGKVPDQKFLHPVVMVSWFDARDYCSYEGKQLPTEEQWEKAARGADGRRWPWGNQMDPSRLNTYYNTGATTAVNRYESGISQYGVYDMAGNVSEWTASDFKPYAGSTATSETFQPKQLVATNAKDRGMKVGDLVAVSGSVFKVRRGGSWKSDPFATSAFHRDFSQPHYASDFFGFRCVSNNGKTMKPQ